MTADQYRALVLQQLCRAQGQRGLSYDALDVVVRKAGGIRDDRPQDNDRERLHLCDALYYLHAQGHVAVLCAATRYATWIVTPDGRARNGTVLELQP